MGLNIIDMITENKYVLSNKRNEFIVIHYTANPDTSAWANAHYFLSSQSGTANYVVDADEIYRSVEDENGAWHCGDTQKYTHGGATYKGVCHNNNSIGIEMCCHITDDDVWYFDDATVDNTIALTKYLMDKYDIDLDHVIRHFDVSGKICPAPYCDYVGDSEAQAWRNFKVRLAQECGIEIDDSYTHNAPTVDVNKSDYQLALDVIAGKLGNGDERRNALGDRYDIVQDLVNRICAGESVNVSDNTTSSEDTPSASESEYEVALDVIAGKYGNGDERRNRITSEGYNYDVIQALVNRICAGEDVNVSEDSNVTPSIDPDNSSYSKSDIDTAYDVIAGLYGNGDERKSRLGDRFDTIQELVNKICAGEDLSSSESNEDNNTEESTPSEDNSVSDSDIDLAYRVIAGEFGNGDERREALGDRFDVVQDLVNRICAGESVRGSVSDESHNDYIRNLAERAIAGEFGNGDERRNALGDDYDEVQSMINDILS